MRISFDHRAANRKAEEIIRASEQPACIYAAPDCRYILCGADAMARITDTKEYLNRAYHINDEIDSKLEQVAALRLLATKATTTLHVTPGGGGYNNHSMESVIAKICDTEAEINAEIDKLVDLKREIADKIKAVQSPIYREVLEKRYLCFKKWEQIAVDKGYSIQRVYQLHGEALVELSKTLE